MDFPDDSNFPNAVPVPNHGMLRPINIDHCYKDYPLTIDSSITVSELKYSIQALLGVPAGKQHMLFNGQLLRDYERLNERPDLHRSTINVHEGILIVAKTISEEMQIVVKEAEDCSPFQTSNRTNATGIQRYTVVGSLPSVGLWHR